MKSIEMNLGEIKKEFIMDTSNILLIMIANSIKVVLVKVTIQDRMKKVTSNYSKRGKIKLLERVVILLRIMNLFRKIVGIVIDEYLHLGKMT